MAFEKLKIHGWRQFSEVSIDFHPRLTVIAGSNGAGKSTILRLLSQHFGFQNNLLSTPVVSKSGIRRYLSGILSLGQTSPEASQRSVGSLTYTGGAETSLSVPSEGQVSYSVQIPNAQHVPGLFINSHRPVSGYQAISSIPANAITAEQAYQSYNQEVQIKYNNSFSQYSPAYRIKEAIVSMATFGPGNRNVQRNAALDETYDDFKAMLGKVLPPSIGFLDISVRIPDVVLVTKTGEFVLDAASGGLMALVDLAWQMFLYSRGKDHFVAVIDEPENHLHPSMQRTIIGSLLEAFPTSQMIVATHSPFVVSSVRDSNVYVLRYLNDDAPGVASSVVSQKLDNINKAGNASEILRSVLGVPVTLPLWAEEGVERIASDFNIETLEASSIGQIRNRLEQEGLGEYYSDVLTSMARRR
ncbi:AAA family ATPase [Mesorhizobium sp. ES1-4]|uniref:AAA family ATPase n=1 Tax=Mesorhizobium sp. ES1-4 TaxID=2876627 RepID=UPI001CCF4DCD|nr:AAA family ATPase [Mesorhizobium sp. ES1-4]MBZ9795572.1 AAA family ATPase [Mesorhizobium sp. ES1-4]